MSHKHRVLVVEDERTIAQAIAVRLEAEGFAVAQVHDGLAALEQAAAWNPGLVILDVMLPGLNGHEVCRRLQADRPVTSPARRAAERSAGGSPLWAAAFLDDRTYVSTARERHLNLGHRITITKGLTGLASAHTNMGRDVEKSLRTA